MDDVLLSYAIKLLSQREYSEKMLEEKIKNKYKTSKSCDIERVISFLRQKNFLNERRTAENFLRYRREYSPRGRKMILQDMYKRKLNPNICNSVLKNFSEEDEQKDCIKLTIQKWRSIQKSFLHKEIGKKTKQEIFLNNKNKLFRYLAGRGFPFFMIQNAWDRIFISFED